MKRIYKCFKVHNKYYVYDRNKNKIVEISEESYEILSNIKDDYTFENFSDKINNYLENGLLEQSKLEKIEHPKTDMVKLLTEGSLHQIILQVTQRCNLKCNYCFYGCGNYENRNHSNKKMTFGMAKNIINYIFEHSKDLDSIIVSFYGGEPLLEFDLINKCIEYIKLEFEGKKVRFSMTTNATLIDEKKVKFLVDNDFDLTISLDGTKELHDSNRKFANGKGSFDIIMRNLKYLKEEYPEFYKKIRFNTVASEKCDINCIDNFFTNNEVLEENMTTLSPINELYTSNNINYNDDYYISSKFELFKVFLAAIGKLDSKYVSKLFSQKIGQIAHVNNIMRSNGSYTVGHPAGPCIPGVMRLFVNTDGQFFPCERVSETSKVMQVGSIDTGLDLDKIKRLINVGQTTKKQCLECWAFKFCGMCAAFSDDLKELSAQKRLSYCEKRKASMLLFLKEICMMKEYNFNFEDGER